MDNGKRLLLTADDVRAVKEVGRGSFGRVFLAHDGAGTALAIKAMPKMALEKLTDGKERVQTELSILTLLASHPHPFLPTLRCRLETDGLLAFVTDYCPGGDLHALRRRQRHKTFPESVIRFYAAELILALEHLHGLGIAYRDLKPENVLVRADGHLMLTDFDLSVSLATSETGTSRNGCVLWRRQSRIPSAKVTPAGGERKKVVLRRSNSLVGTEEYVAPEMLARRGHDTGVDWWALGIMLYEMMYGKTPFRGARSKDTFCRILFADALFEGPTTTDLKDLVVGLLQKKPQLRLGCGEGGASEVKRHAFFRGVDWDAVREMRVRAPSVPGGVSLDEFAGASVALESLL